MFRYGMIPTINKPTLVTATANDHTITKVIIHNYFKDWNLKKFHFRSL